MSLKKYRVEVRVIESLTGREELYSERNCKDRYDMRTYLKDLGHRLEADEIPFESDLDGLDDEDQ